MRIATTMAPPASCRYLRDSHNMEVGDESLLGVKIGQHNIFWGETC